MSFNEKAAEELAMRVLSHIAERPDLVSALFASSGLNAEMLRKAAESPDFHAHLLDFLLEDDRRVVDFAQEEGIRPEQVLTARTVLAGPGSFGWEPD